MLTYLQDIDRLSVYVVCNFALSLSLFYLLLYVLLCDMLVAYGPLSLTNHQRQCTTSYLIVSYRIVSYVGDKDVGSGRVCVCRAVAAVPRLRRLQFVRHRPIRGHLADAVLSPDDLRQQRHQSDPVQRHVRQVLPSVRPPAALRQGVRGGCRIRGGRSRTVRGWRKDHGLRRR